MKRWHLSENRDGKGRPYRIVRLLTLLGPCPNEIDGCFLTKDWKHVQGLYEEREDIPAPRFQHYHYRNDNN